MAWLRRWLKQHVPPDLPRTGRYIFMDQGGELYKCELIRDLFELEFYYQRVPIGTEANHENGFIE